MKSTTRVAIIGGGQMGNNHAESVSSGPDTELVGIADPFTDSVATRFQVPYFTDHISLINAQELDAVIIANPNHLHIRTALDFVDAGIPTLLEKPVGVNASEIEELASAEERTAVPVLVGHHRRHHPIIAQAKEIIESGRLGRLVAVNSVWFTKKPEEYFSDWRSKEGAGVTLINLVHDIDVLRYLCGDIRAVQSAMSSRIRELEVEDTASAILEFRNGALGTVTASDAVAAPWGWDKNSGDDPYFAQEPDESCLMIVGTLGSLQIPQLNTWHYPRAQDWTSPLVKERIDPPSGGALARQLAHFVEVVRGKTNPKVTVRDAAQTVTVVSACHEAARSGQRVLL